MQDPALLPVYPLAVFNQLTPGLYLVTGPRGAGKTSWCAALVADARAAEKAVGGILCPAIFENGVKTGISLEDLQTGERRRLGSRNPAPDLDFRIGRWHCDSRVLQWGNDILQHATDTDLTIIDELGPLELTQGHGFQAGVRLLDQGTYRLACAVIRPELLAGALVRWPAARVIELTGGAA